MEKVYEALLELNKQMLLQNLSGEMEITLTKSNWVKLATFMDYKFRPSVHFQQIHSFETIDKSDYFKIAGPGGYITIRKAQS